VTDEPFTVAWTPSAQRALRTLPEKVATAIVEFCYGGLAANPARVGHPLLLELKGIHSARRGDYRVIYAIDADSHTVTIHDLAHRSDAYRPRG
jgi:mRNA-degrading endonuclease RelE of RelBE toxin-antitoxin system